LIYEGFFPIPPAASSLKTRHRAAEHPDVSEIAGIARFPGAPKSYLHEESSS
jgi:hypothetical protein